KAPRLRSLASARCPFGPTQPCAAPLGLTLPDPALATLSHRRTSVGGTHPCRPATAMPSAFRALTSLGSPHLGHLVGRWRRVLLGGQSDLGSVPHAGVPTVGGGRRERPPSRPGHHRQQPPVVLRSFLRPPAAAAKGHVPGQGGILHWPRGERPAQQSFLPRGGTDSGGPDGRPGERASTAHRLARAV